MLFAVPQEPETLHIPDVATLLQNTVAVRAHGA